MSSREYNGVIADLDIEEYHCSPGVSRSGLVAFKRSPLHYWHEHLRDDRKKREPTEAMVFGNAFHSWILESHTFHNRYRAYTKTERRSKAGRQYYESERLAAAFSERILISMEDCEQIKQMGYAIDNHPVANALIQDAKYEQSFYWKDNDTGILCKCRPDILQNNYVADLKTTTDASQRNFEYEVKKYSYDLQAAMIHEGIKNTTGEFIDDFVFIAIEKEPPYAVGVYQLDKAMLQQAVLDFHELLVRFAECQQKKEWPGYEMGIVGVR